MKNKLCLVVLLAFFGWTCKDKIETVPEVPKHDVSFSISGLANEPASLEKKQTITAASVFDEVGIVDLYVYNSRGYLVAQFRRYRGMNSSVFVTAMEAGQYTAVAVGSVDAHFLNPERLQTARLQKYYPGQILMDKVDFEVGTAESASVSLTLQRKVGMLELDITDKPGADILYINVKIDAMAYDYSFRDMLPVGDAQQLQFVDYPHAENYTDFPAYFFVPGNSQAYKTTITLELLNVYSEVMKTIILKDVTLGVNRKTTIRGKLYHPGQQDLMITVDDAWGREDIIDF